jgi:hypothetical protein
MKYPNWIILNNYKSINCTICGAKSTYKILTELDQNDKEIIYTILNWRSDFIKFHRKCKNRL